MRDRASNRSRWPVALSVLLVGLVVAIAIAAGLVASALPISNQIGEDGRQVAAGVIFVGSYLALAIGRVPGLSIDRAGIALVGAGLMVASGALPLEDAYKAVDLDTITLLLGMMIVVANLRLSGFFALATAWVVARASGPCAARGDRRDVRRFFRFSGERRDLPGAGAAGAGDDARDGAQAPALSAGGGDGVQCRLDRDDHRQSAEHHDRQFLAHSLCQVRRWRWRRWRWSGWS